MPLSGGCRCGAVRYELKLSALPQSYACHCLDCQTWSGSAFAIHALIPEALFEISGGSWGFRLDGVETMDSDHIGCASCLTRIANHNPAVPGMIILRMGTLDLSQEIAPSVHIWTKRKQPWLSIPKDTPAFEETPSQQDFAAAIRG